MSRLESREWVLDDAVDFVRELSSNLKPVGFDVGLMGSVLMAGVSRKDLDIIVFPLRTDELGASQLIGTLNVFDRMGMKLLVDTATVHRRWRALGSGDEKLVDVWAYRGKRVDVFWLK